MQAEEFGQKIPHRRTTDARLHRARHRPLQAGDHARQTGGTDAGTDLLGADIECLAVPLDNIRIRDTGPFFVLNAAGDKAAIDFNVNGHPRDALVAAFIAEQMALDAIRGRSLLIEPKRKDT